MSDEVKFKWSLAACTDQPTPGTEADAEEAGDIDPDATSRRHMLWTYGMDLEEKTIQHHTQGSVSEHDLSWLDSMLPHNLLDRMAACPKAVDHAKGQGSRAAWSIKPHITKHPTPYICFSTALLI